MENFNIWSAQVTEEKPPRIEFIVTPGESDSIGEGSDTFVAGCLADLGVQSKLLEWTLEFFRSSYFCEERDPDDWRDKWCAAWKVRAVVDRVPVTLPSSEFGSVGTGARDEKYTPEKSNRRATAADCVVIADFPDQQKFDQALSVIKGNVPRTARFGRGRAFGKLPQLQINIGHRPNSFFEASAREADEIVELCEQFGGMTTHRSTFRHLADSE